MSTVPAVPEPPGPQGAGPAARPPVPATTTQSRLEALSKWLEQGRWHFFGGYCLLAALAVLWVG